MFNCGIASHRNGDQHQLELQAQMIDAHNKDQDIFSRGSINPIYVHGGSWKRELKIVIVEIQRENVL